MRISICCSKHNDLYQVLSEQGIALERYDDVITAVNETPDNSGLLLMADHYPKAELWLDEHLLRQICEKSLRVYAEYPAYVHGWKMEEARAAEWERVFVSSDFFAPDVKEKQILAVHGCWHIPMIREGLAAMGENRAGSGDDVKIAVNEDGASERHEARVAAGEASASERHDAKTVTGEDRASERHDAKVAADEDGIDARHEAEMAAHMMIARVAGYDQLAFEVPEKKDLILFQLPGHEVLVSTTKLSQFVTGRYGPQAAWAGIWKRILGWLDPNSEVPELKWTPHVIVQFSKDEPLRPEKIYGNHKGFEADQGSGSTGENESDGTAEKDRRSETYGITAANRDTASDGSSYKQSVLAEAEEAARQLSLKWFKNHALFANRGKVSAIEGYAAQIDHEGKQLQNAYMHRADCITESAMAFAAEWALNRDLVSKRIAAEMMDSVWKDDKNFLQADPASPVYGLVNWYDQAPIFYGDDNARVLLASLFTARMLDDDRWDEAMLRCILANYRTTGKHGYRRAHLVYPAHFENGRGWEHYREEDFIHYSPHFQCYLWACYLWAYDMTGYEPLLETSKKAIRMMMEAYPDKWQWTNGLTQEMARMLLPLSYLIRVEDTEEHREWLKRISGDLLKQMQPCGAIAEKLGPLENGRYPAPQSNESYGVTEASLIQNNGDPASDLLYTVNFAYLGLHEAVAVTEDPVLKEAEDRLTEFLVRIQVRSEKHPYLDGAWMRSFDFDKWEYWGSSADHGWGAWCIETGWTNSWINAIFSLRCMNESLYDLSRAESFRKLCPRLVKEMLEEKRVEA